MSPPSVAGAFTRAQRWSTARCGAGARTSSGSSAMERPRLRPLQCRWLELPARSTSASGGATPARCSEMARSTAGGRTSSRNSAMGPLAADHTRAGTEPHWRRRRHCRMVAPQLRAPYERHGTVLGQERLGPVWERHHDQFLHSGHDDQLLSRFERMRPGFGTPCRGDLNAARTVIDPFGTQRALWCARATTLS